MQLMEDNKSLHDILICRLQDVQGNYKDALWGQRDFDVKSKKIGVLQNVLQCHLIVVSQYPKSLWAFTVHKWVINAD